MTSRTAVAGRRQLSGHLTPALQAAPVVDRVPPSTPLHLTIGLTPKDQAGLDAELAQIANPKSPSFRHYLSDEAFTEKYGASSSDYEAVVAWALSKHLEVTRHSTRLFVSVRGAAADIEQAFNVHLNYALRQDGTKFYKPDAEPSVDSPVPVRYVSHLTDYVVMRGATSTGNPAGTDSGIDLRTAYAKNSAMTGQGQTIGLWGSENYSFDQSDIDEFNAMTLITGVPPVTVVGDMGSSSYVELTIDIEASQSMAPAAAITMFFGSQDDIITAMTDYPGINQFSSSFFPSSDTAPPNDVNLATGLQTLAARGQSFFNCSGDIGAYNYPGGGTNLIDVRSLDDVTVVAGTQLSLNQNASAWSNETVWSGSGGGFLVGIPIPDYQFGLATTLNQASSVYRNLPDVTAIGSNFDVYYDGSWGGRGGTSVAAPTWAGFMALVNQQAQALGLPTVGFANPLLYSIASSSTAYANDFHDVVSGTNPASADSNFSFSATAGYDLTSGLGSPTANLIPALAVPHEPPAPGCTYTATLNPNSTEGVFVASCNRDAANDAIYLFSPNGFGGWLYFATYQGPAVIQQNVPGGTTATFLACTFSPQDFPAAVPPGADGNVNLTGAWQDAVTPGLFGCDQVATQITLPVCVPTETPASYCTAGNCAYTTDDGCGHTFTCPACECLPTTCEAQGLFCGYAYPVDTHGNSCGEPIPCKACPSGESCSLDRSVCCASGESGAGGVCCASGESAAGGHCCPSGTHWQIDTCVRNPIIIHPQ